MKVKGTKTEYNVEIEIETKEIFNVLKQKVLGCNKDDIDKAYINKDNNVVKSYSYHGSWEDEEIITSDSKKVEIFKIINKLEKELKEIE